MREKVRDLTVGILFLAFAVFFFLEGGQYPTMIKGDMGSAFMPQLIAVCIGSLSAAKIVFALCKKPTKKQNAEEETTVKKEEDLKGGLMTVALIVTYALAFKPVGFLISTFAYLFLQMLVLCDVDKRKKNTPTMLIIAVIAPIVIYVFFMYVVGLPVPKGILSFL